MRSSQNVVVRLPPDVTLYPTRTGSCAVKISKFVFSFVRTGTDNQMKFYNVVSRPTVLYGSETWLTTKRDMTGLEAAEMRLKRSVKG
jgi:hypothetical protein